MKKTAVTNRIKKFFPFAITIILWHLSDPLFNPFGALSLIPIYYYMYVRHVNYWFVFGLFMSSMVDFNAGTLFMFCSMFIITNAINETYGVIENESGLKIRGFNSFLIITILAFFIFSSIQFGDVIDNFIGSAWLYFWIAISYFPVTAVLGRISNDR